MSAKRFPGWTVFANWFAAAGAAEAAAIALRFVSKGGWKCKVRVALGSLRLKSLWTESPRTARLRQQRVKYGTQQSKPRAPWPAQGAQNPRPTPAPQKRPQGPTKTKQKSQPHFSETRCPANADQFRPQRVAPAVSSAAASETVASPRVNPPSLHSDVDELEPDDDDSEEDPSCCLPLGQQLRQKSSYSVVVGRAVPKLSHCV